MNRRTLALPKTIAVILLLPLLFGCGKPDESKNETDQGQRGLQTQKGPYGGKLFELADDHSLHAELVKDYQADRVIVYILNASFVPQPNAAPDVTLVITGPFAGSSAFLLRPPNRSNGKSAQFELIDEQLEPQLESEGVEVELHITINDKKVCWGPSI